MIFSLSLCDMLGDERMEGKPHGLVSLRASERSPPYETHFAPHRLYFPFRILSLSLSYLLMEINISI